MADGVVEGYYFARFQGYDWWNLIASVSGEAPFLDVDWVLNLADDEWTDSARKIKALKEEMVFGPKVEMPSYKKPQTNPPPVNPNRALSVSGWIRAVDEELVNSHLGVAYVDDDYESARDKLHQLIQWHVEIATDPTVNGGYELKRKQDGTTQ